MLFVFLLYALFASVFTISKIGLETTQPFFLVGSRMLIAGILLLTFQAWFRPEQLKLKLKDFWKIFQLAFISIYLTNVCEFWGLQYLTSAKTCFLYSLSPFASALLSYLVFSEPLSKKKWVGLIIGFTGMLPILLSHTTAEERGGHFFIFSWPELAVLTAALASVYGWILLKQLVQDRGYSPLTANGLSMLIGGLCAITHSLFVERWQPLPIMDYTQYLQCAAMLIIISNLICYNLYGFLLKKFSPTFMSFAGLSTPLFSSFFGWFFLGELVGWEFYSSLAIVSIGLTFFYQEELKAVEKKEIQPIT